MKAPAREGAHSDARFLPSGVGRGPGLHRQADARPWGTTRKLVRNGAGTRTPESVVCEFMGKPVWDIRTHLSRRLLSAPGVSRHGCRTRVLPMTWPGHPGRSRA